MTADVLSTRGRVAALTRTRPKHDPEFIAARRDHAAAMIETFIESVVASAPPLTDAQAERIAAILRGGAQ